MAVDTLEDLAAALDENPAGREAVRVRLLTRELLELPQTVARTAVETDRRFSKVDRRLDDHDRRFDRLDANLKRIRDDLGLLERGARTERRDRIRVGDGRRAGSAAREGSVSGRAVRADNAARRH